MAGKSAFNDKDSMDISELASLNDDISPELIEQLQQKLTQDAMSLNGDDATKKPEFNSNDDTTLFEEPQENPTAEVETETTSEGEAPEPKPELPKRKPSVNFDDNFLKKYKAKLSKQRFNPDAQGGEAQEEEANISNSVFPMPEAAEENIEELTNGNITEKPITPAQKNYNDSLDYLDGNVKYAKYVIYIDPQNVDFIESLTVKERKNLINKVLREQDDIAITKQRFKIIQTVIKHTIVAILTIAVSIPIIYLTINASLEASINNYRRSQSMFQTLYKQGGKIKAIK